MNEWIILALAKKYARTLTENIPAGKSAYEVAVENGFEGTEEEWLSSLIGPEGLSAYELWLEEGNEGSVADFLEAIKGETGNAGVYVGTEEPEDPDVDLWINPDGSPMFDANSVGTENGNTVQEELNEHASEIAAIKAYLDLP